MPQDPMAMGRAIQAIMAQAGAWVTQYKSDLTARGLGFTPDDLAAIAASATAHPLPPAAPRPRRRRRRRWSRCGRRRSRRSTRRPGSRPTTRGSPRWACRWSPTPWPPRRSAGPTRTTRSSDRVVAALGHTRDDYDKAGDHWTPMLKTDMAVATLYGQLFGNVGELTA